MVFKCGASLHALIHLWLSWLPMDNSGWFTSIAFQQSRLWSRWNRWSRKHNIDGVLVSHSLCQRRETVCVLAGMRKNCPIAAALLVWKCPCTDFFFLSKTPVAQGFGAMWQKRIVSLSYPPALISMLFRGVLTPCSDAEIHNETFLKRIISLWPRLVSL